MATFSTISIDQSGTGYRFQATSGALTLDISNAFSILGGAPVRFAFTVQPTNTAAGGNITPVVRVTGFDALDNIATFSDQVSLTITAGTGTAGAVHEWRAGRAGQRGRLLPEDMSVNLTGTGYTLTTSAPTLPVVPAVTSTAFNITP